MNNSKLAGRTALLKRDKDIEAIIGWLTEQPEVDKIIPRGWKPGGSRGKTGLRVDGVSDARISGSVFHGNGRQTVLISATDADAAVALVAKSCQKFGWPPPNGGRPVEPVAPKAKANLVPTPGVPMKVTEADRVADDARVISAGRIVSELRKITPEIAAKWLQENTNNRPISERAVQRYASDMKAGRWGVSESVIAFDTKGRLINGQHRLWAVMESGETITAHVATGYPPEAIAYFDDGFRRDNTQVYNLVHGTELSKAYMTIARRLAGAGWRQAEAVKSLELSRQDVYEVLEKYRDGIEFAVAQLFKRNKVQGVRTGAVMAVVARAFYTVPVARLEAFCDVMRTGIVQSPSESAAILLRNWLMSTNVASNTGQLDAYAKTERALKSYLSGEAKARNLFAATEELFPLPGETPLPLPGKSARVMRAASVRRAQATRDYHKAKTDSK